MSKNQQTQPLAPAGIPSILALLLALSLGVLGVVLLITPPVQPQGRPAEVEFDASAMLEAVAPAKIGDIVGQLGADGSRALGSPGHAAAASFLRRELETSGYEVIERRNLVAAPVLEKSEILLNGAPAGGIELHPFGPNHFQPIATPPGGLTGRLILLNDATLNEASSFQGGIGVVDLSAIPQAYGLDWVRYAQLGLEGIMLAAPQGFVMDWSALARNNTMVSALPVNFLRVYATGPLLDLVGQEVTIHVRQRYHPVENVTLLARLPAPGGSREALVLTAAYDTYGILPTLANEPLQAVSPATVLAAAKGLAYSRATLQRDVLVVFDGSQLMGGIGEAELIRAIGMKRTRDPEVFAAEKKANEEILGWLADWTPVLHEGIIFSDTARLRNWKASLSPEQREFFDNQVRLVLQSAVFEQGENLLQGKLPLDRSSNAPADGAEQQRFKKDLAEFNFFKGASSVNLERLVQRSHRIVAQGTIQKLLLDRIEALRRHHAFALARATTDATIREAAGGYDALFVLNPRLLPSVKPNSKSEVAFIQWDPDPASGAMAAGRQEPLLSRVVQDVQAESGLEKSLQVAPIRQALKDRQKAEVGSVPSTVKFWNRYTHPAYMMVNTGRLEAYQSLAIPTPSPSLPEMNGLDKPLALLGQVGLAIAHGAMPIRPPDHPDLSDFSGSVLASGVGQSVIPNFPVENALVGAPINNSTWQSLPGYFRYPLIFTDIYGRYALEETSSDFIFRGMDSYSPQAFWFGEDGTAQWVKDATGSKIFKSEKLPLSRKDFSNLNLVVFRADPVSFLDLTNPHTLQPFAAAGLISREGLSPLLNSNFFIDGNTSTVFAPPDLHFYGVLRAGLPDNPLVQTVRGFLLGPAAPDSSMNAGEISGEGYLVADQPLFSGIALPMAQSMLRLNETRADLQAGRNLLDPGTEAFIKRSAELLGEAEAPGIPLWQSVLKARESAAYSAIVHPILRANINGAVVSIIWYLGLLVPFVFFMERLLFGFADIRKQLAAQALIFLVVFGLLRLMHPAFDMIRSAFMILLGFVILLIAGGVTVIFAGKFRENMAALEALRGKAAGASVNTMGIVATAFLLGLNNMHRRKVRTGLTCGTLVLITFAMIAFTSVRHEVVESVNPVGPAPYQGLLIQNDRGQYISASEVFALTMRFGRNFPVEPRGYYTGVLNKWSREIRTPALEMRADGDGNSRSTTLSSLLQFGAKEPMRGRIPLLTKPFWFDQASISGDRPVIISDRIANDLGIDARQVDQGGGVPVILNGARFRVAGIFDSEALDRLRDLNGQSLLPPDVSAIPNVRTDQQGAPLADPNDPRVPASDVAILAYGELGFKINEGVFRIPNIAIGMDGLPFREARAAIMQYLEQTGATMFFGLDGVASQGTRARSGSLQGLPDLVMPLVIAALTVLNTMKGSVYERRDEIYVYNAVGVAPRYVFFMFFAEAFVYSVVGAVLGYLLAQSTGFFLTAMDWTGGLNMTFAGVNTIFASLAVIAAVFISTLFPARTAMQIAAPSEESGWSLPEPENDRFSFYLPFTFSPYDRIAVLAFFHRFLLDHGEGGSGLFRAGPPHLDLAGSEDDPEPRIHATIWLKPYDLGVSQELVIALPHDLETEEFIAGIEINRLSGTKESWVRLNRSLMEQVRRQFLHWRAVTPAQKAEFHAEALALFAAAAENRKEQHV